MSVKTMNKLRESNIEVEKSSNIFRGEDRVNSSTTGARKSPFSGLHPLFTSGGFSSFKPSFSIDF